MKFLFLTIVLISSTAIADEYGDEVYNPNTTTSQDSVQVTNDFLKSLDTAKIQVQIDEASERAFSQSLVIPVYH